MDKMESLLKDWKEMTHSMEMELQAKDELIDALKGQIRCLKEQITLLEDEKKRLIDAGNKLSKQCEDLDKICMCQQELIEELQTIFSDLPEKP